VYDVINTSNNRSANSHYHPHSPSKMCNGVSPRPPANSGTSKPPPTGPRTHKKPRLSQSPLTSTTSLHPHSYSRKNPGPRARSHDDRIHDRDSIERKVSQSSVKMEVDGDEPHLRPSGKMRPDGLRSPFNRSRWSTSDTRTCILDHNRIFKNSLKS